VRSRTEKLSLPQVPNPKPQSSLVMNLSTWLRQVFCVFLYRTRKTTPVFGLKIISNYIWRGLKPEKFILNRA